jgi:hypothetical protein
MKGMDTTPIRYSVAPGGRFSVMSRLGTCYGTSAREREEVQGKEKRALVVQLRYEGEEGIDTDAEGRYGMIHGVVVNLLL